MPEVGEVGGVCGNSQFVSNEGNANRITSRPIDGAEQSIVAIDSVALFQDDSDDERR